MPREGYSSITIKDELYEELKERAKQHKRTVPKELEMLIKKQKKEA